MQRSAVQYGDPIHPSDLTGRNIKKEKKGSRSDAQLGGAATKDGGKPRCDRRPNQPRPAPRDAAAAGAAAPQSWVVAWALLSTVHHTLTAANIRAYGVYVPDQCGWVGKYLDRYLGCVCVCVCVCAVRRSGIVQ